MKAILRSICLTALLLTGAISAAKADELVSTGMVKGFQPKEGTLTILSDQTHGLITLFGVDKAQIYTNDGKAMMLADLKVDSKVTVEYAVRGNNQWYISKVILPSETVRPGTVTPAPQSIQINAEPSNSNAAVKARDGDITTSADVHPGKVERLRRN